MHRDRRRGRAGGRRLPPDDPAADGTWSGGNAIHPAGGDLVTQRTLEGGDQRERIDRYLRDSGMASRASRVVPLTGDASDRRYFRIHLSDGDSVVLALHAGPIDFSTLP